MNVRDWALITFTILGQMSVGSFLVLGIAHFFAARKAGVEEADRMSDRILLAVVLVLGLALIASLFHLGHPLNAYRAVTNIGSSWLSLEVLTGVIFFFLGAVFALMQWRKVGSFTVRNVIAWIAALVGLFHVYAQGRIYMQPAQPSWNTLATPFSFFTTTFLLGALAMGAAFVANYAYLQRKKPDCAEVQCTLMRQNLHWISITSVALLGIELLIAPFYISYLAGGGKEAVASASMLLAPYGVVFALRLILVFIGAGVFGAFLYQKARSPGQERIMGNLAYGAFVLVLTAEVLGRFLFYAIHMRIGV